MTYPRLPPANRGSYFKHSNGQSPRVGTVRRGERARFPFETRLIGSCSAGNSRAEDDASRGVGQQFGEGLPLAGWCLRGNQLEPPLGGPSFQKHNVDRFQFLLCQGFGDIGLLHSRKTTQQGDKERTSEMRRAAPKEAPALDKPELLKALYWHWVFCPRPCA